MKPTNIGSILAKFIAAVMLFAALGRHAYDYYTLPRWISCDVCAFTAFQAMQSRKTGWLNYMRLAITRKPHGSTRTSCKWCIEAAHFK